MTVEERIRQFEEYQRNKTAEDIRIDALEEEDDERYLAENPVDLEFCIPWEDVRNELVMEGRLPARGAPRIKKSA